ncbi:MAG TPA: hypothetical protein VMK05_13260 [Burkholderiales bacterium]|nr:hypothetical protein [Burkholderiales bacterium]
MYRALAPAYLMILGSTDVVGKVLRGPFALGSKSERSTVYLKTAAGEFMLRRRGGDPYQDAELDRLVGKTIRCHGELLDYILVISDWSVIA